MRPGLNDPLELLLSGQVSQKTNCEKKIHERNIFHEAWLNDHLELLLSM